MARHHGQSCVVTRTLCYWQHRSNAPEPGHVLGPLAEIPDGAAREYRFGTHYAAFSMFVVRRGQAVYGFLNLCPHNSLTLNIRPHEFLSENGDRIRCSRHFAEFRIEDGFGVLGAAENCWLESVPVEVRSGQLRIVKSIDATNQVHDA